MFNSAISTQGAPHKLSNAGDLEKNWKNIGTIANLIVCTGRSAAIHCQKSAANPSPAALISTNPGGIRIAVDYISYLLLPEYQFAVYRTPAVIFHGKNDGVDKVFASAERCPLDQSTC